MQAKKQDINNLKQEARVSWNEVKQQVLHLQEENHRLRHDLEVNSALRSRLLQVSPCRFSATHKAGFSTMLLDI